MMLSQTTVRLLDEFLNVLNELREYPYLHESISSKYGYLVIKKSKGYAGVNECIALAEKKRYELLDSLNNYKELLEVIETIANRSDFIITSCGLCKIDICFHCLTHGGYKKPITFRLVNRNPFLEFDEQ